MANANSLLLSFHVITAILIVVLILLQKGKEQTWGRHLVLVLQGHFLVQKALQTSYREPQQFSQQFSL